MFYYKYPNLTKPNHPQRVKNKPIINYPISSVINKYDAEKCFLVFKERVSQIISLCLTIELQLLCSECGREDGRCGGSSPVPRRL